MTRSPCLLASIVLAGAAGVLLNLNGCGVSSDGAQTQSQQPTPIQHVVIIFQENRTTDNMFQDPVLIARGADIAQTGLNSKGQAITLSPIELASPYDLNHNHPAFMVMYDGGKMDGADLIPISCPKG